MNNSKINAAIENLNLGWQEYDFGDTLYAKVATESLYQETEIASSCETEKYRIQFQQDGYAWIFTEVESVNLIEKVWSLISRIDLWFFKQNSYDLSNSEK